MNSVFSSILIILSITGTGSTLTDGGGPILKPGPFEGKIAIVYPSRYYFNNFLAFAPPSIKS